MEFVALDLQDAEARYRLEEPVVATTPETIFDARSALSLLSEARNRLSQEHIAEGKTAIFEVLKPFLYPANEKLPAYEVVADQLKVSVAAVKTLIHRFRKRYTALVREEVIRTVPDSADVDAEIFVKL